MSKILKNRVYILLSLIVILAFFLRTLKISEIPVSPYWDEVAIGYNAFSISETLKDEYGTKLPILFKSYNDYKMPLYIYASAIPIKILGLNEFSTRIVSALFGTLTIFVTFYLIRILFSFKSWKTTIDPTKIALLGSFLLAISPWHIQFSRAAFEANTALFFVVLGVYLFIRKTSILSFSFSLLSFSLAFYTYRSVYIFLPVLLVSLLILFRKNILTLGYSKIIIVLFAFIILISPVVKQTLFEGSTRYTQASIKNEVNEVYAHRLSDGKNPNRKILYAEIFINNYTSHFSPSFLFLTGDPNGRHSTKNMGMLYLFELPFLLFGLYLVFKNFKSQTSKVILIWILASILPAAISTPAPHALRSLNILPIPQLLAALGIVYALRLIPNKFRKVYLLILSIIIILSFVKFVSHYIESNTRLTAELWGDGYKQLFEKIIPYESSYDKIIVSGHYWQPYTYALFYKKYDPKAFQENGNSISFDKYYFGGTSWDKEVGRDELDKINLKELAGDLKTLIVLSPEEYDNQAKFIKLLDFVSSNSKNRMFIIGELK